MGRAALSDAVAAETQLERLATELERAWPDAGRSLISEPSLPWLLGTARKVIANQRRAMSRREALTLDLRSLQPGLWSDGHHDEDRAVLVGLAGLSEPDREAILLVAWEGLDPASAAAVMNCSRATFSVRLHRARRRLADLMAREAVDGAVPGPTEVTK